MNALHGYTPAEDGLTNKQFHDQIRLHMAEARQMRAEAMAGAARRLGGRVAGSVAFLTQPLGQWRARRRHQRLIRDELSAYSDHELDDIGVRRTDVPTIARKAA